VAVYSLCIKITPVNLRVFSSLGKSNYHVDVLVGRHRARLSNGRETVGEVETGPSRVKAVVALIDAVRVANE